MSVPHWLLARGLLKPCHATFLEGCLQDGHLLSTKQEMVERANTSMLKMEVIVFYNLTLKMIFSPLCHMLLVTQTNPNNVREGYSIFKRANTTMQISLGPIPEYGYHNISIFITQFLNNPLFPHWFLVIIPRIYTNLI